MIKYVNLLDSVFLALISFRVFDTVLYNSECIFSRLWQTCHNLMIKYVYLLDSVFSFD